MQRRLLPALVLSSLIFSLNARAQDCAPPPLVANARSTNIFTPEQEMTFGDLVVERLAGEMRFVRDPKLLEYVGEIGSRIIKHLPPTGLAFRFHLVDIPEANAFNLPGGHVMLSRKLVAFANNEDELAGVIAHELGHAVVRHAATDISESLRRVLNVTSLGDRRDVAEKYNLLIERARTRRVSRGRGHENEQQLEADRIGLHAMVAAGYAPEAFTSAFDRLVETEGRTGNWFSDLFGKTRPEQKRLREMMRAADRLAPECREGRAARATDEFLKWQADVVSFREAAREEQLPGMLWRRDLSPKLRSDVSHLAFSRDGRLLLAQDDFAVTVVERDPPRVLFQIPVEEADEAAFTPDGKYVIFTTKSLRYEKWGVAERKPVEVRELVLRGDCWEHKLSPDGNYLACVDTATSLNVLETRTGKKVWGKKEFYPLTGLEYLMWLLGGRGEDGQRAGFFRINFSPDSRHVMFSRSDHFRFRIRVDGLTAAESENTALALDLSSLKTAEVGGDIKKLSARSYVFLDPERILGMPSSKTDEAGVFSFPGGKRLQKFTFYAREVKATANPDYVIMKPLSNIPMGIYDLKRGAVVSGLDKRDGTIWNNLMAYEASNGKVLIREVNYNEAEKRFDAKDVGSVELPVGSVGRLDAADVSDNFDWLLLSSRTRGGLWSLRTGERKLYVRGFKGGVVADDGGGVADFPRMAETRHSLALMNPHNSEVAAFRELPERGARQHGRFVLLRRSLKEKKGEKRDGKKEGSDPATAEGDPAGSDLRREVRFELKDFIRDQVIWSRDFPKEAPEFSFDEFSGRLIFYWRLGSDAGKERIKESPGMRARADALGNRADDYLVEVVDSFSQKTVGELLIETGKGSFDVGDGLSEGDWLVLRDSQGRVLVYTIKDGDLRHRFFGDKTAVNPRRNQIAVENFPGEVSLYDLATGDRQTTYVIKGRAAFARFNLRGDRLFVLSDTQTAYAFDLDEASGARAQGAAQQE